MTLSNNGSTKIRRLCVYCASSLGARSDYVAAAHELATVLLAENIGLIYGGAAVGIMGQIADAVLAGGGEVIGVIPQALVNKEIAHPGLTELRVVESMHERKALMAELADGFVALPGGLGTLEEIFEIVTWAQLGMHGKPCGLLNICGYYDHLNAFLDHAVQEQLLKQKNRELLMMANSPHELLKQFRHYVPRYTPKWITAQTS